MDILLQESLHFSCTQYDASFGYDHMTEDESRVMEAKQREVLDNLGITR